MDSPFDAVILGAGGAGLLCAITAGKRGRKVAVLDHAARPGGKIIISGGGRCNFTNREVSAKNYVSRNAHFAKSALARFTPDDFLALVQRHGIAFHERSHGQLFCDGSARQLVVMLEQECAAAGVELFLQHEILSAAKIEGGFRVATNQRTFEAPALVIATGGLSFPKFGATSVGYELATSFGLTLVPRAPALDGFVFGDGDRATFEGFSGVALDAELTTNGVVFRENLLFTHQGFSGPVALQASLYWNPGDEVRINFLPALTREALLEWFSARKGTRLELKNQLATLVPKRLAERFLDLSLPEGVDVANLKKSDVAAFCEQLQHWKFLPQGTVGYGKAEVTRGGVDTDQLSSKTMEARKVPGLYCIGEVVDVTGWLGGFNYQWAWASGSAAGHAL